MTEHLLDFSTTRQWIEYLFETRSISPDRVIVVNCCDGGTAYVSDKHWFVTECTGQLVRPLVVTHEHHISHVQIVVLSLVPLNLSAYVFWHCFACLSFSRSAALTAMLSWLSSVETYGSLVPGSLSNSNRCGLNLVEVCGVALYHRKNWYISCFQFLCSTTANRIAFMSGLLI